MQETDSLGLTLTRWRGQRHDKESLITSPANLGAFVLIFGGFHSLSLSRASGLRYHAVDAVCLCTLITSPHCEVEELAAEWLACELQ